MAAPEPITVRLVAEVDRHGAQPLSTQITEHLWEEILDGTLAPGDRLPTVRQLAVALGVHPRVVERAFADLEKRGVTRTGPGGTFVDIDDTDAATLRHAAALEELCRQTADRAEEVGVSLDEVIEALTDLRADRHSRDRS